VQRCDASILVKLMNRISLETAHDRLCAAAAVIVRSEEDNPLVYPSVSSLTGDPENEFLYLSWSDWSSGFEYSYTFKQEPNECWVETQGSTIFLIDNEGFRVELELLAQEMSVDELESLVDIAVCAGGMLAHGQLGIQDSRTIPGNVKLIADEFNEKYKNHEWDGEYIETVDDFAAQRLKEIYPK
jgi:hypothetical protein